MLFTLRDNAAMLGVSRNRVHELINSERLASVKPGRSRRISIGSIRRFVHAGMAAASVADGRLVTARFTSCCGAARFWRAQGLDFDHCGLRVAPSSRRRLRPLRHGLPWRLAPPASKSESIRLQTPLNGLSERRHRSGPKPDAGSCTSLGARIDLVDDSRAYPSCPGRKSMCALSLTYTCEQKPLRAIPSQRIGFG